MTTSKVTTQFHRRHRSREFRQFLDAVDAAVPRRLDVHVIMDNYGTPKTALIRNWLAKRPRFHVHFTPTYGSWLNLADTGGQHSSPSHPTTRRKRLAFAAAAVLLAVILGFSAPLAADLYFHHRVERVAGVNIWGGGAPQRDLRDFSRDGKPHQR